MKFKNIIRGITLCYMISTCMYWFFIVFFKAYFNNYQVLVQINEIGEANFEFYMGWVGSILIVWFVVDYLQQNRKLLINKPSE